LVDDEFEILELTKDELAPHFENIMLAINGAEAMKIIKKNKVDLIVTDYIMPVMNGLQLIASVKELYPMIPVVMLTSNGSDFEIVEALQNGAFDILDKPFRSEILVNRIQNGLLVNELTKTLWSLMCRDLSLPRLEDFLQKSTKEQHQLIYAYSSMLKMKSLFRNNSEDV
jgi:DNA-binding response OmpR family regulator